MNTLIKEYFLSEVSEEGVSRCIILTRDYNKSLDKLNRLIKKAKNDFKELKDEDIEICVYRGNRRNRIMGIEFLTKEQIPEDYKRVNNIEPT